MGVASSNLSKQTILVSVIEKGWDGISNKPGIPNPVSWNAEWGKTPCVERADLHPAEPLISFDSYESQVFDQDHPALTSSDSIDDENLESRLAIHFDNIMKARTRCLSDSITLRGQIINSYGKGFLCFMNSLFNIFGQSPGLARYLFMADHENRERKLHKSAGYPLMKQILLQELMDPRYPVEADNVHNVYKNIMFNLGNSDKDINARNSQRQQDSSEAFENIGNAITGTIIMNVTVDGFEIKRKARDITQMDEIPRNELMQMQIHERISCAYGLDLRDWPLLYPQLSKYMVRVIKSNEIPNNVHAEDLKKPAWEASRPPTFNIKLFISVPGIDNTILDEGPQLKSEYIYYLDADHNKIHTQKTGYVNANTINKSVFHQFGREGDTLTDIRTLGETLIISIGDYSMVHDAAHFQIDPDGSNYRIRQQVYQWPLLDMKGDYNFREIDKENQPAAHSKYTYRVKMATFRIGDLAADAGGHYISLIREDLNSDEWNVIDDEETYPPPIRGRVPDDYVDAYNRNDVYDSLQEYLVARGMSPKIIVLEKYKYSDYNNHERDERNAYFDGMTLPFMEDTMRPNQVKIEGGINKAIGKVKVRRMPFSAKERNPETKRLERIEFKPLASYFYAYQGAVVQKMMDLLKDKSGVDVAGNHTIMSTHVINSIFILSSH